MIWKIYLDGIIRKLVKVLAKICYFLTNFVISLIKKKNYKILNQFKPGWFNHTVSEKIISAVFKKMAKKKLINIK